MACTHVSPGVLVPIRCGEEGARCRFDAYDCMEYTFRLYLYLLLNEGLMIDD